MRIRNRTMLLWFLLTLLLIARIIDIVRNNA